MTDPGTLRLYKRYDEGEGPAIVLLHGINRDATDWRRVIDAIGPGFRCIAFDLLGFGRSPRPLDLAYSADEHARVLENALRQEGSPERFMLVGYSLGGDVAIRYASTHPGRVRRLLLLSVPFFPPDENYRGPAASWSLLGSKLRRWAWRWVAWSKHDGSFLYRMATGRMRRLTSRILRADDLPTRWEIMSRNLLHCVAAATFVDDLPGLTMPTTFALGTRDLLVPDDQARLLEQLKPDLEIRRIPGLTADHMMLDALPERVAEEILREETDGPPRGESVPAPQADHEPQDVVRGAGLFVAGALVLSQVLVPVAWIARAFAAWIAYASVSTMIGTSRLRREDVSSRTTWMLVGATGIAASLFMLREGRFAEMLLVGWILAWAIAHALPSLYVAFAVPVPPGPRGWLALEGALAAVLGVVTFVAWDTGVRVVLLLFGGYLAASGLLLLLRAARMPRAPVGARGGG